MAIKDDREYRNIGKLEIRDIEEATEPSFYVEGYASTFDPYKLYEYEGNDYFEVIDRSAFDNADLSDVVFLRDHEGRVLARTKNGSVELSMDDHGLKVRANLGLTAAAREMREEIEVGNYSQMSFAFVVEDEEYDKKSRTRVIKSIRKLYDISAVAFPANPGTDIGVSMRDYFNGVIEAEKAERLEAEKRAKETERMKLLIEIERIKNGNQ